MDRELGELFGRNARRLVGAANWAENAVCTACSDAGDLSQILPMLHPNHGGCTGYNHTVDFAIVDPDQAYVTPAKALVATVVDLLCDDARGAAAVMHAFRPNLTRDAYLAQMRALTTTRTYSYRRPPAPEPR